MSEPGRLRKRGALIAHCLSAPAVLPCPGRSSLEVEPHAGEDQDNGDDFCHGHVSASPRYAGVSPAAVPRAPRPWRAGQIPIVPTGWR